MTCPIRTSFAEQGLDVIQRLRECSTTEMNCQRNAGREREQRLRRD